MKRNHDQLIRPFSGLALKFKEEKGKTCLEPSCPHSATLNSVRNEDSKCMEEPVRRAGTDTPVENVRVDTARGAGREPEPGERLCQTQDWAQRSR